MILKIALAVLLTCDPALTSLFTPARPGSTRYEVCTTTEGIRDAVPPGTVISALEPLDAFGEAGPYDRSRLARLYGGIRASVGRAWIDRGHEVESDTYISPYPNAALTSLEPGTLVIRVRVPRNP
jgi:hypothetical protein